MTELLIFGVDGMSRRVMQRIDDQYVPNIRKLEQQDRTAYGEYHSFASGNYALPETGPAWTTMYTSLQPEEHGLMHEGWNEGDSIFHELYTVWDKLADNDISIGMWGMPMTYRAKDLGDKSYMLSGFVSTTFKSMFKHAYHPDDLELDDNAIEYTSTYAAKVAIGGVEGSKDTEETWLTLNDAEFDRLNNFIDGHRERENPEVVAYGTTFADKIGHVEGIDPENEWTQATYQKVDLILGLLIAELEPENVVIVSDHGFFGMQHDFHGYYLNTEGTELGHMKAEGDIGDPETTDLLNFVPFLCDYFGIQYNKDDYGTYEAEAQGLSSKEKQDARGRLADLGYIDHDDVEGTGGA